MVIVSEKRNLPSLLFHLGFQNFQDHQESPKKRIMHLFNYKLWCFAGVETQAQAATKTIAKAFMSLKFTLK